MTRLADVEELRTTVRTQNADYPALIAPWEAAEVRVALVDRRVYRFGAVYFDRGDRILVLPDHDDPLVLRAYSTRLHLAAPIQRDRVRII